MCVCVCMCFHVWCVYVFVYTYLCSVCVVCMCMVCLCVCVCVCVCVWLVCTCGLCVCACHLNAKCWVEIVTGVYLCFQGRWDVPIAVVWVIVLPTAPNWKPSRRSRQPTLGDEITWHTMLQTGRDTDHSQFFIVRICNAVSLTESLMYKDTDWQNHRDSSWFSSLGICSVVATATGFICKDVGG